MSTSAHRRLWQVYGAVGIAVMLAGLPLTGLIHSIVYDLIGLSAVVAILVGVRIHRPAPAGGTGPA